MFKTTLSPRFGDTDMLGHINNVALPRWFETAREPVFRLFFPDLENAVRETWPLILVHMEFDFHAEMKYGSNVELRTAVTRIGNTSLTLRHEAWQNGKKKGSGTVTMVHYDFQSGEKKTIPDTIRLLLEEHMAE